jgi:hypothetical protein
MATHSKGESVMVGFDAGGSFSRIVDSQAGAKKAIQTPPMIFWSGRHYLPHHFANASLVTGPNWLVRPRCQPLVPNLSLDS